MKVTICGESFECKKLSIPFWVAADADGQVYAFGHRPRWQDFQWRGSGPSEYLGILKAFPMSPSAACKEISETEPAEPEYRISEKFISFVGASGNWESVPIELIRKIDTWPNQVSIIMLHGGSMSFKVQKPQDFIDKLP